MPHRAPDRRVVVRGVALRDRSVLLIALLMYGGVTALRFVAGTDISDGIALLCQMTFTSAPPAI
jgi:hypothetical protein